MPLRLMQVTVLVGMVFIVVAAAVTVVAVNHWGGPREVLQLPAVLDPATPAVQNGFTLIAIARGHPNGSNFTLPNGARMNLAAPQTTGDTVLWIRPPVLPLSGPLFAETDQSATPTVNGISVRAHSSSGDVATLPWYFEGGCIQGIGDPCTASRISTRSPDIIATLIPSGYPNDVNSFGVSITDTHGHKAFWTLEHIPRMRPTPVKDAGSSYTLGGATVQLNAVRTRHAGDPLLNNWYDVDFYLTLQPLSRSARHQWEFRPSPNYPPSLSWEPYRLPWLTGSDSIAEFNTDDSWLLCRQKVKTGVTSVISTPYLRRNTGAIYHGYLTQFETREDSVDLHNVSVISVEARQAGQREDAYCLQIPRKIVISSPSGLTITLPKQKKNTRMFYFMAPNSLNFMWRLNPLSPGSSSQTAGLLPDSPLCRKYKKPVTVWFEAFIDGKPIGYLGGVPWQPADGSAVMVHFPTSIAVPSTIDDLKITIHQRVDLQSIPVALSTKIVDTE